MMTNGGGGTDDDDHDTYGELHVKSTIIIYSPFDDNQPELSDILSLHVFSF
jgi:hypothetical protein